MSIDMDDMRIGKIRQVFDKILEGVESERWDFEVRTIRDYDSGTESSTDCHMVIGRHIDKDIVMKIFPDKCLYQEPVFKLTIGNGDDYIMKSRIPSVDGFDTLRNKLVLIVENYVDNLIRANKREEEKRKQEYYDGKSEELLSAL